MARNRGTIFEGQVLARLTALVAPHGWAVKLREFKAVPIPGSKFLRAIPADKMPADFLAFHGGNHYLIEAKTTRKKILPIGDGGVQPHQLAALIEWEMCSPESFLIVECLATGDEHVRRMSGHDLKFWLRDNPGAKSIPLVGPDAPGTILGPPEFWKIGGR